MAERDRDPTDTMRRAMDALWSDNAMSASALFHQLADEMQELHDANDGVQFAPDLVVAIEDCKAFAWMVQRTEAAACERNE